MRDSCVYANFGQCDWALTEHCFYHYWMCDAQIVAPFRKTILDIWFMRDVCVYWSSTFYDVPIRMCCSALACLVWIIWITWELNFIRLNVFVFLCILGSSLCIRTNYWIELSWVELNECQTDDLLTHRPDTAHPYDMSIVAPSDPNALNHILMNTSKGIIHWFIIYMYNY